MEPYNVTIKGQQVLIPVDSDLFKELLTLAIYAKNRLKITDRAWCHSPELYEEMLKNHVKVMKQATQLPEGNHTIQL